MRILIFLLGLMMVAGELVAAEPSEAPNFGFERLSVSGGAIGWKSNTIYPLDSIDVIRSDPSLVRSGSHAVRLEKQGDGTDAERGHFMCQTAVPIQAGSAPYTLSFWTTGTGQASGALYLYRETEAGEAFLASIILKEQDRETARSAPGGWTQQRFVADADTIPAEAITARVVLLVAGEVVVDDVSFTSAAGPAQDDTSTADDSAVIRTNLLTVGQATQAPRVDGRIDDEEYTTPSTGLLDNRTQDLYPYDNWFAFAADEQRLYFALDLTLPPGYEIKSSGGQHDDNSLVAADDVFYLMIRPDADTSADGFEGLYLGVSASGMVYDAWEKVDWANPAVTRDVSYDAGIESRSHVVDGRWVVELAIPRKALRLDDPSADVSLATSFGARLSGYTPAWQLHGNWFDHPQAFGRLRLVKDLPWASVHQVGNLAQGQLRPSVRVHNPSGQPVDYEVQGSVATPRMVGGGVGSYIFDVAMNQTQAQALPDEVIYRWMEQGTAAAGDAVALSDTGQLAEPQPQVMEIDVRAAGQAVYYLKLPFRYEPVVTATLTPRPSLDQLRADLSFRGASVEQRGTVHLEVVDEQGETVWQGQEAVSADQMGVSIPLDVMKPGEHEIQMTLTDPQGRTVGTQTRPFHKPETPDWLANRKGIEALEPDWVPEPWHPVQADDHTVEVWGRRFELGAEGLLTGLASQDREVLRGPVTVHYRDDSGEHVFELQSPQRQELHQGKVVYSQTGQSPGFELTSRQQIEFDGMDRFDVTITPRQPTEVEQMWIDIPMADLPYSMLIALDNFWQHGLVTEEVFQTPRAYSVVWLGDEQIGCAFFAENYRGWLVDSSKPRVTVQVSEGGKTLRLHLVNTPQQINEPMVLTFGLHPTPTKPLFEGWRQLRPQGMAITPPPTNMVMAHSDYWGASDYNPWPRTWEVFEDAVDHIHGRDQRMYPYLTGFSISPYYKISDEFGYDTSGQPIPEQYYLKKKTPHNRNETYFYYAEDWRLDPPRVNPASPETREEVRTSPSSSWSDYFIGGVYEMLHRTELDGVYMDIHRPSLNYDPAKNLTYVTVDGVHEGSIELFATRDFYKRLYYIFEHARDGDSHPWILGHGFGGSVPYCSFWDINFNGEEIKPSRPFEFTRLNLEKSLVGTPLAQAQEGRDAWSYDAYSYRSVFASQFGSVSMFLPQYAYKPELKTAAHAREVLSFTFLHNNLLWPAYLPSEVVYKFWSDVEIPYDMTDTTFHPYWNNDAPGSPQSVKVSYWSKPEQQDYLVAIANWSDEIVSAQVQLPSALRQVGSAQDMESGDRLDLQETLSVELPPHDLRVFRLRAE